MKEVTILGSTGSIGTSTLDVIRRNANSFRAWALVAGQNVEVLTQQILEFRPKRVVVGTESVRVRLLEKLAESSLEGAEYPQVDFGSAARVECAVDPAVDIVVSAIVGVAGLEATYEAVKRGKKLGLANKEALVAAGALVTEAARQSGTELLPIDSEHNGAHQCLRAGRRHEVSKLILTASGGPFRNTPKEAFKSITPAEALNHPTWKMGPRITIDSATLMNKGFEVIEACWLFDFAPSDVEVVVHPQSTVHAMVEYNDGSVIAQVCATDMRMPIQYALTWPDRFDAPVPRLDWSQAKTWQFAPPDFERFPLLKLAYQALESGGSATCTLNAADEVAVERFLEGEISFPMIAEVVEETLNRVSQRTPASIAEVLEVDRESRDVAREIVQASRSVAAGPIKE